MCTVALHVFNTGLYRNYGRSVFHQVFCLLLGRCIVIPDDAGADISLLNETNETQYIRTSETASAILTGTTLCTIGTPTGALYATRDNARIVFKIMAGRNVRIPETNAQIAKINETTTIPCELIECRRYQSRAPLSWKPCGPRGRNRLSRTTFRGAVASAQRGPGQDAPTHAAPKTRRR